MKGIALGLLIMAPSLCAQDRTQLRVSLQTNNILRIEWNSEPDTAYQVLGTTNYDVFATWQPVSPEIVADSTNTLLEGTITNTPFSIFKLHQVWTQNSGIPSVRILDLTNSQVLSGEVDVYIAAQDDSRLSQVSLYLDGWLLGTVTEGMPRFFLDTTHYTNGLHTLVARAADNAGISYLGGDPDTGVMANEAFSETITVEFQNVLRWLEPDVSFETYVPIDAYSDVFPTNWTVSVEDESGTVVRTFSGYTIDGTISTNWDGTDNNAVAAPENAGYQITLSLGTTETLMAMQNTTVLKINHSTAKILASRVNNYGVLEYEVVQEPVEVTEDLPISLPTRKLNHKQSSILMPPLPDLPIITKKTTPVKRWMAPVQIVAAEYGNGGGGGPVTIVVVWREQAWSSGQIIIARQRYKSTLIGYTFNAVLATMESQMATKVTAADAELGNNGRGVYGSSTTLLQYTNDYPVLLNDLSRPEVRDFYHHGHSSGNAIGFSEYTSTTGLKASQIAAALTNIVRPFGNPKNPRVVWELRKPFRFVFLDGCLSGTGNFPNAFGIPRQSSGSVYTQYHKKKRAFMGWGTTTQNSIANSDFLHWSSKFLDYWIGGTGDDYDVYLNEAINIADVQYPGIHGAGFLSIYGSQLLTWGE